MTAIIEGKLTAKNKKFAIVVGRFNELISRKLVDGAMDCLLRHEADDKNISVIWTPGSFEIPLAAKRAAESKKFDAVICLGAIIRGGTPHFEYVASEAAKGVAQVSLSANMPVIFGIITADSIEQAVERAGTKAGNKGWDAALAAIEMADLLTKI
ncbi:MAG: 6,7-dimethyl-8-ribityllumazine synthase [Calditrichaceae bacterium]|nr:6,7-dimethyl-8-ribityllumazine synthase [Calditrichaceae bacterium]MBN2707436.1 6,7-dimethyl-8-ribityllumazine synthase [Calditrichaceae bacterium]RQV94004.1 MAG: 6,7-dimethyl-8-ribityllumazine synthase [Calditrichota bacterium]